MSHPPHLTSSWSSALIPFCAYKTDLNFSKKSIVLKGTTFPLCSSFVPTILEGQLCYELTLNKTSGEGKRNELMLLLDYNEDRSLQTASNNNDNVRSSNQTLNFDTAVESLQGESAKVQIKTLSRYNGFGGGIYMMTDVKRMTAKKEFLKMSLKDKNCEVELYEDCRQESCLRNATVLLGRCLVFRYKFIQVLFKYTNCYSSRGWRYVGQPAETALRGTPQGVSTAAQLVRASMLTSSWLVRKLKMG